MLALLNIIALATFTIGLAVGLFWSYIAFQVGFRKDFSHLPKSLSKDYDIVPSIWNMYSICVGTGGLLMTILCAFSLFNFLIIHNLNIISLAKLFVPLGILFSFSNSWARNKIQARRQEILKESSVDTQFFEELPSKIQPKSFFRLAAGLTIIACGSISFLIGIAMLALALKTNQESTYIFTAIFLALGVLIIWAGLKIRKSPVRTV